MANTHHTGIPKLQWVGAYPPCTPSASISVDLSPFCAGDSVMFTPTLNCVENVIIASYAWVVNGVIKSTSPDPFVTTELLNNDKVYFLFVANENIYVSNVITVVEKTEGCEEPIEPVNYGLLYNWYAATDVRGITSSDEWVVPTVAQFQTLIAYLGGSNATTANKLRDTDSQYWVPEFAGATNESGFYGRGAGSRWGIDGFKELLSLERICVINEYSSTYTYVFSLSNNIGSLTSYIFEKINGRTIRHIKNSTILTHGQTGTYTGNDGKVYRTICIGTQEWLADNLCETKFRNGDWIPGFDGGVYTPISNGDWAALTTGALCAYDNDWNNV